MKVQENTGDLIEVLPSEIMEVDDPALNETTRWTICQKRIEHSSSEKSSSKISKGNSPTSLVCVFRYQIEKSFPNFNWKL